MKGVLIDDDDLFRTSLRTLFETLDSKLVLRDYAGVKNALRAETKVHDIDLVLLDYHLPGTQFLSNLKALRAHFCNSKIAILSAEQDPRLILQAIHYGAFGFIPKTASSKVLSSAIKLILCGNVYLPEAVLNLPKAPSVTTKVAAMTQIKKRVLKQLVSGKANKVIEYELGIASSTLNGHLAEIYTLLGVKNRTEAVIKLAQIEI